MVQNRMHGRKPNYWFRICKAYLQHLALRMRTTWIHSNMFRKWLVPTTKNCSLAIERDRCMGLFLPPCFGEAIFYKQVKSINSTSKVWKIWSCPLNFAARSRTPWCCIWHSGPGRELCPLKTWWKHSICASGHKDFCSITMPASGDGKQGGNETYTEEHGIRVPVGLDYTDSTMAKADFQYFRNKAVVIKPPNRQTWTWHYNNKNNDDVRIFERAIDIAFEADQSILIEEFIEGKEFRIFVMNDEVAAILQRVPANVTGDGIQYSWTCGRENKDPLRGKGYHTPLEKFNWGGGTDISEKPKTKTLILFRWKWNSIPPPKIRNISTGGDSIDFHGWYSWVVKKLQSKQHRHWT